MMTLYTLRFKCPIRLFGHRSFSTFHGPSSNVPKAPFSRPSPPPLPAKDQAEFERLVKQQQTPFASPTQADTEMHPDLRPKPAPEFEGEVNPKTGEVGGPKRDPLKWEREWAYGGRATDF